jgi:hypothetical protein
VLPRGVDLFVGVHGGGGVVVDGWETRVMRW